MQINSPKGINPSPTSTSNFDTSKDNALKNVAKEWCKDNDIEYMDD